MFCLGHGILLVKAIGFFSHPLEKTHPGKTPECWLESWKRKSDKAPLGVFCCAQNGGLNWDTNILRAMPSHTTRLPASGWIAARGAASTRSFTLPEAQQLAALKASDSHGHGAFFAARHSLNLER